MLTESIFNLLNFQTRRKPMTHPFALSIDDLACIELVDETQSIEGGGAAEALRWHTLGGHENGVTFMVNEGGILTHRWNEGGHDFPPFVSTNVYPEHGGPIPVTPINVGHDQPYLK
jgi:hypothetical protein